jgi:hypothetical protein
MSSESDRAALAGHRAWLMDQLVMAVAEAVRAASAQGTALSGRGIRQAVRGRRTELVHEAIGVAEDQGVIAGWPPPDERIPGQHVTYSDPDAEFCPSWL